MGHSYPLQPSLARVLHFRSEEIDALPISLCRRLRQKERGFPREPKTHTSAATASTRGLSALSTLRDSSQT